MWFLVKRENMLYYITIQSIHVERLKNGLIEVVIFFKLKYYCNLNVKG